MSATEWEQVGTVEVLSDRVYPLDPTSGDSVLRTTVFVEPGVYPVYRKADAYRWVMSGRINERQEKIGDGLFVLHPGDNPSGQEVTFPSQTYGPEQLADLLAESICQPGPEQRLRFELPVGVVGVPK
jgi:hypothetical protein